MFRTTVRAALPRRVLTPPTIRTLATTAKPKRSFLKSFTVRTALAAGIVYYYTTSAVFADEPRIYEGRPPTDFIAPEDEERPKSLIDELLAKKNAPAEEQQAAAEEEEEEGSVQEGGGGLEHLEEEAGQQGAFNPETGEINWDCPCLGGMAHGPCGEEFKAAFSCFIYSEAEPKGVDCIEKFKGMQTCFQEHPEIYGAELGDDEEEEDNKSPEETKAIEDAKSPELKMAEAEGRERKQTGEDNKSPEETKAIEDAKTPEPKKADAEGQERKLIGEDTAETLQALDVSNASETRSPATSAMVADAPTEAPLEQK